MSARRNFESRLKLCENRSLEKLLQIVLEKNTTLCVEADLKYPDKTVRLVDKIGDLICILKIRTEGLLETGVDIREYLDKLCQLKKKFNFMLLEDRKFFDGAQTVQLAYSSYVKYVDLVTIAPEFGDAIFQSIATVADGIKSMRDEPRGCLAIYDNSSNGRAPLIGQDLLEEVNNYVPICIGIIAQKLNVLDQYNMIKATPGVNLSQASDGKNQQWRSPDNVVADGADVVIVGRGIISQPEEKWESCARSYKEKTYEAYVNSKRISFQDRLNQCTSPLLKKLYQIIIDKKSTLCVAADFRSFESTLKLIDSIGPHICMLKLHTEFSFDSSDLYDSLDKLSELKRKYKFLLFEDRKFYEDSETDYLNISCYLKYVDVVTVVPRFGDTIFEAFKNAVIKAKLSPDEPRGCLAVCELSFKGVSGLDERSLTDTVERNSHICSGVATSKPIAINDSSPMIRLGPCKDVASDVTEPTSDKESNNIIVLRGLLSQPEDRWMPIVQSFRNSKLME